MGSGAIGPVASLNVALPMPRSVECNPSISRMEEGMYCTKYASSSSPSVCGLPFTPNMSMFSSPREVLSPSLKQRAQRYSVSSGFGVRSNICSGYRVLHPVYFELFNETDDVVGLTVVLIPDRCASNDPRGCLWDKIPGSDVLPCTTVCIAYPLFTCAGPCTTTLNRMSLDASSPREVCTSSLPRTTPSNDHRWNSFRSLIALLRSVRLCILFSTQKLTPNTHLASTVEPWRRLFTASSPRTLECEPICELKPHLFCVSVLSVVSGLSVKSTSPLSTRPIRGLDALNGNRRGYGIVTLDPLLWRLDGLNLGRFTAPPAPTSLPALPGWAVGRLTGVPWRERFTRLKSSVG